MKKPNFDGERRGVFSYGAGNLSARQLESMAALIPRRWHHLCTRDRVCRTDAQRLLQGLDEALGYFDAAGGRVTAVGNAIEDDLQSIANAAGALMRAIQRADKAARVAIDCEAVYCALPIELETERHRMTQTSKFAVHWFEALRDLGHLEIASAIEDCRAFERRAYSFLSALWDLSADAVALAKGAAGDVAKGVNIRPDRVNAQAMARSMVSHAGRCLGRPLPVSPWVAELIHLVASYRDVTIGKSLALKEIRAYATRLANRNSQVA